jgi:hypothetical protein
LEQEVLRRSRINYFGRKYYGCDFSRKRINASKYLY